MNILESQINHQKLSHSYLFICNDDEKAKTAINEIVNCLKITPADCFLQDQTSSIKIADIRKLQGIINLKPHSSKYKLAVIMRAENLTTEAANALLKILEESPDHSIIILVSGSKDKILPTIVSRCQIIRLNLSKKISDEDLSRINDEIKNLGRMSLRERFSFIEELLKLDSQEIIMEKLSDWLEYFRKDMVNNSKSYQIAGEILISQRILLTSNVNKKLLLENLIMLI